MLLRLRNVMIKVKSIFDWAEMMVSCLLLFGSRGFIVNNALFFGFFVGRNLFRVENELNIIYIQPDNYNPSGKFSIILK